MIYSNHEEWELTRFGAKIMTFIGGSLTAGLFLHIYNCTHLYYALGVATLGIICLFLLPLTQRRPVVAGRLLIPLGVVISLFGIAAGYVNNFPLWSIGAVVVAGGIFCFMWHSEVPKTEPSTTDTSGQEADTSYHTTEDSNPTTDILDR